MLIQPNRKAALLCLLIIISAAATNPVAAQAAFDSSFIEQELERVVTDPENSVTIDVDAPIEFVFKFLMERLDLYTEDAVSVSFDVPGKDGIRAAVGTERTTVMTSGENLVQRFLQVDAYKTYAYFTDISKSSLSVPLKYSLAKYNFKSLSPDKTQVDISVVYQPSSRLTAFIVRRLFNSAFERDFKKAATMMGDLYLEL